MIHPVETAIPLPYDALRDFCERHHITRLWVFGSALRDDFRPDSDIDLLVEFDPAHRPGWAFFGALPEELSAILG
jgi:hypothetical protein